MAITSAFAPPAASEITGFEVSALDVRLATAFAAASAGLVSLAPPIGPLCPLRRLTGIPCPLCGLTSAAIALGHGHPVDAVLASPLIVIVVAFAVWAFLPARVRPRSENRKASRVAPGRTATVAAFGLAWLYQLARFHLLPNIS